MRLTEFCNDDRHARSKASTAAIFPWKRWHFYGTSCNLRTLQMPGLQNDENSLNFHCNLVLLSFHFCFSLLLRTFARKHLPAKPSLFARLAKHVTCVTWHNFAKRNAIGYSLVIEIFVCCFVFVFVFGSSWVIRGGQSRFVLVYSKCFCFNFEFRKFVAWLCGEVYVFYN